jgi:uncharacterized protein YchJ
MKTKLSAITIAIAGVWTLAAVQTQAQESSPAAATKTETAATAAQRTDTEWDGVSVELTSVTRGEGDTITIKFRYTNSGSKTADITQLGQFSFDNVAEHVYYVDPGNKKKYLVIKDAEGKAIASNMQYLKIEAGASRAGWAKFPAPPPGVSKISVYLPGGPPFEGVTIASQ